MAVGMNLENVVDWSPAWVFTDAFQASRPWIAQAVDLDTGGLIWDVGESRPLDLDARGNVASLAIWTDGGRRLRHAAGTLMFREIGGAYPAGTYRAEWSGTGTVAFGFDARVAASGRTEAGVNWADLAVTPTAAGILLRIEATDPADPIRDCHVWMPDWQGRRFAGERWQPGAAFSPFHPLFLQLLAPFDVIRFMGMQETNTSEIVTWSDRRTAAAARQGSGPGGSPSEPLVNGLSLELMVQLANDLDADPWFNMPHMADDGFVANFATYVRDHLEPGRKVYVEWANEVWNFGWGFEASLVTGRRGWAARSAWRPTKAVPTSTAATRPTREPSTRRPMTRAWATSIATTFGRSMPPASTCTSISSSRERPVPHPGATSPNCTGWISHWPRPIATGPWWPLPTGRSGIRLPRRLRLRPSVRRWSRSPAARWSRGTRAGVG